MSYPNKIMYSLGRNPKILYRFQEEYLSAMGKEVGRYRADPPHSAMIELDLKTAQKPEYEVVEKKENSKKSKGGRRTRRQRKTRSRSRSRSSRR